MYLIKPSPPTITRRQLGTIMELAVATTAVLLLSHAQAFAAAGGGGVIANGLGGQAQKAAADIQSGGSYVFDAICFILAAAAGIAAVVVAMRHHKNPNSGEHRLGYAFASAIAAGLFATLGTFVYFSSNTVSGAAPTVTDQPAQLTFGTGGSAGGG